MSSSVIKALFSQKIAAITLPAYTSDRLQQLDVSVFCSFLRYDTKKIEYVR